MKPALAAITILFCSNAGYVSCAQESLEPFPWYHSNRLNPDFIRGCYQQTDRAIWEIRFVYADLLSGEYVDPELNSDVSELLLELLDIQSGLLSAYEYALTQHVGEDAARIASARMVDNSSKHNASLEAETRRRELLENNDDAMQTAVVSLDCYGSLHE